MRTSAAVLGLGAALLQLTSGCIPLGGCGGVDPTDTFNFALSPDGATTVGAGIAGIAGDASGIWVATPVAGGVELTRFADLDTAPDRTLTFATAEHAHAGLAWDGAALWLALTDDAGATHAVRIDTTTGDALADVALPTGTTDLAWDNGLGQLVVAEGVAAVEGVDPATGLIARSIPVRAVEAIGAIAWGGELWTASTTADDPLLVYYTGDTLYATAPAPTSDIATHMTFMPTANGSDLVMVVGGELRRYTVAR
ncbi:MAG: hypothetical protein K8W52_34120 [Deltaproteobacteria bacterium]|nr:hypothetical protein [Deltaproteobacteria bacterium]